MSIQNTSDSQIDGKCLKNKKILKSNKKCLLFLKQENDSFEGFISDSVLSNMTSLSFITVYALQGANS